MKLAQLRALPGRDQRLAQGYVVIKHIVHRDVKPSNVLISADRCSAKLTDFGLAARLEDEEHGEDDPGDPLWGPVGARPSVGPRRWRRWKIAVRYRWKQPAHIKVLELYAGAIAMSWVLRKGSPLRPRRMVIPQDSQVAVHPGRKGRGSSLPLLRAVRRTASLVPAGNLYVDRL